LPIQWIACRLHLGMLKSAQSIQEKVAGHCSGGKKANMQAARINTYGLKPSTSKIIRPRPVRLMSGGQAKSGQLMRIVISGPQRLGEISPQPTRDRRLVEGLASR
jgi:hypothetical protein